MWLFHFFFRGKTACTNCPGNTDSLAGSYRCNLCKAGYILDDRPWKRLSEIDEENHNTTCIECSIRLGSVYENVIDAAFSCIKNYSTGSGKIRDYGTTLSEMKIRAGWWRPSRYTYLDDGERVERMSPWNGCLQGWSGPWDGTDMYCAKAILVRCACYVQTISL